MLITKPSHRSDVVRSASSNPFLPFPPRVDNHLNYTPQRWNTGKRDVLCLSSKMDRSIISDEDSEDSSEGLFRPKNPLRVQLMEERRLRANGLMAGMSFVSVSLIVGCLLGFFNPLVLFGLGVVCAAIFYTIIESSNEYRDPLPSTFFQVQESTIPNAGMGLFAGTNIAQSTFLFDYEGEVLNEEEYFSRYPNGDGRYVAQVDTGILGITSKPVYIDGIDPEKSNLARYMNSASGRKANVYWKKQPLGSQAGTMHFYTLRDIQKGEELCFDYGDNYWQAAGEIDSSNHQVEQEEE